MEEVEYLHSLGILELTIIAQDTTAYGSDLKDMSLAKLLDSIANLNYFKWIRVLYLYPDEITDDLIQTFKKHDSILNYFDIPIQHASNKLLENMNRRGSKEYLKLLDSIYEVDERSFPSVNDIKKNIRRILYEKIY